MDSYREGGTWDNEEMEEVVNFKIGWIDSSAVVGTGTVLCFFPSSSEHSDFTSFILDETVLT